ncbi:preprotein translocase subunit SecG [Stappia sp. F7233]|uniref:Protein-export membrane protein SecG n=1 Tax=Stappia albiluteola TaxID=2758565 RepID=A0A839ABP2_9HYPH|nr:preprotein translocase subunit SecG [Stappia albiluteola]MBA5776545.1 preprotein translocase subunit SecG [Stappia albiluteola]
METVIIVIHLMVVLALVLVVLLQRSEGGALGIGGGSGGFMSSRGSANVLTRATAVLALAFFATSLVLAILARTDERPGSILDGGTPSQTLPANGAEGGQGILDTLKGQSEPQAPVQGGPQVPAAQ